MSRMSRMRGSAIMAATAAAAAAAGASLAYAVLIKPSVASHPGSHASRSSHHLSPPPELPSSSKLLIPNINVDFDFGEPEPDVSSQCDYGPLWECIVNGNGGCEVLEEELRDCLTRARKPEPSITESNCDYAPLWECIVNGNGGCEVLEEDLRRCLDRSRKFRRS